MLAGVIHEKRGDIPKAREHYEKVLALSPPLCAIYENGSPVKTLFVCSSRR